MKIEQFLLIFLSAQVALAIYMFLGWLLSGKASIGPAVPFLLFDLCIVTLIATSFVKSFFTAEQSNPPCPHCKSKLRTKLAKQCFHCGADWHDS